LHNSQLTIIGNGDAFGSRNHFHTCFHLEIDGYQLLVDCGATAVQPLFASSIELNRIDAIIITHFHGDHYGGVPFFLLNSYFKTKRDRELKIIGPPGCQKNIETLVGTLYGGLMDKFHEIGLSFDEYGPDYLEPFKDLRSKGLPVIHAPESIPHGVRIEGNGKIFGFSGDTEWTETLIDLSEDADLFICECNNFNTEVSGHLNHATIKEKSSLMSCKRQMLTHLGDEMYDNLDQVEFEVTEEGSRYEF